MQKDQSIAKLTQWYYMEYVYVYSTTLVAARCTRLFYFRLPILLKIGIWSTDMYLSFHGFFLWTEGKVHLLLRACY